jgi:nitrate/nitrite-specific signal transduction histidine kinase
MSTTRSLHPVQRDLMFVYECVQKLKSMVPRRTPAWGLLDRMEARLQGAMMYVSLSEPKVNGASDSASPVM